MRATKTSLRKINAAVFLAGTAMTAPATAATAWVTNGGRTLAGGGTIALFDTHTLRLETAVPIGGYPAGLAFTPGGAYAYISDYSSNVVSVLNARTLELVNREITPDGKLAYVLDRCDNRVTVIDTQTRRIRDTVAANAPISAAFIEGGDYMYLLQNACPEFNCTVRGAVSLIETYTDRVGVRFGVGWNPRTVALTPQSPSQDRHADQISDTGENHLLGSAQRLIPPVGPCARAGEPVVMQRQCLRCR